MDKESIIKYYDYINSHNKKVSELKSLIWYKYHIYDAIFKANDSDKIVLRKRLKEVYDALDDFDKKYDGFFSLKFVKPINFYESTSNLCKRS